ncbi:MAG TPA: hypothetical protein VF541_07410 [Longimicrobium sp.]|jgi:hypothetical protein
MTLSLDALQVMSFETGAAGVSDTTTSPIPYSPYCCTDNNSGCDTNVEAGCPGDTTVIRAD